MPKRSLVNFIFFTAFLMLGLTPILAIAEINKHAVTIGFVHNKPPYSSVDSEHEGIEIELARAALAEVNLTLNVSLFDNDKLGLALKNQRVDAMVSTLDFENEFHASNIFIKYHDVAITKAQKLIQLKSIHDIRIIERPLGRMLTII